MQWHCELLNLMQHNLSEANWQTDHFILAMCFYYSYVILAFFTCTPTEVMINHSSNLIFPTPQAGFPVPIESLISALTSGPMQQPMPVMMEAIECMRSRGLKTAVLSNNFLTLDKKPYMPLNPALFDVVRSLLLLAHFINHNCSA